MAPQIFEKVRTFFPLLFAENMPTSFQPTSWWCDQFFCFYFFFFLFLMGSFSGITSSQSQTTCNSSPQTAHSSFCIAGQEPWPTRLGTVLQAGEAQTEPSDHAPFFCFFPLVFKMARSTSLVLGN